VIEPDVSDLVRAIHAAGHPSVLALSGGGSGAAARLLGVPGASRSVLEVVVPYHPDSMATFLRGRPARFCSPDTARALAIRCTERGAWLAPGQSVAGIGCTASLTTERPKRGPHQAHIGVRTVSCLSTHSLVLTKGQRDRSSEELLVDRLVLNALADAVGLGARLSIDLLPGEEVHVERHDPHDPVAAFLAGGNPVLCIEPDGRMRPDGERLRLVVSGSFDPVHEGHWGMAKAASRLTGLPVVFELSAVNVDKPVLSAGAVRQRLQQFAWRAPVWLTRAPTFLEKAELFPGAAFVVGTDTAERLLSPRYYEGSETRMVSALSRVRGLGCRFLVAGRVAADNSFTHLHHLAVPAELRDLFTGIPESDFRVDVSSTQLRAAAPSAWPVEDPTHGGDEESG
jgi:hypothetical protein